MSRSPGEQRSRQSDTNGQTRLKGRFRAAVSHFSTPGSNMRGRMSRKKVLFVCTGNAVRSQMAEALARLDWPELLDPFSGGSNPAGWVHPHAIEAIAEGKEIWEDPDYLHFLEAVPEPNDAWENDRLEDEALRSASKLMSQKLVGLMLEGF